MNPQLEEKMIAISNDMLNESIDLLAIAIHSPDFDKVQTVEVFISTVLIAKNHAVIAKQNFHHVLENCLACARDNPPGE